MPALTPEIVPGLVSGGASSRAESDIPPKFQIGDRVRTKNINPTTHTRLPRYVRGKQGVVHLWHGTFHFNDALAHGKEEIQHSYSVKFKFRELWGDESADNMYLYIDMFEGYMDIEA
jgi:nitrile hydratase